MPLGWTFARSLSLLALLCLAACVDLTLPPGVAPEDFDADTYRPLDAGPGADGTPVGDASAPVIDASSDLSVERGPTVDVMATVEVPPSGLALGARCTGNAACAQGHCVDGVCCATACTDACYACNLSGTAGTCVPEPANTICAPATCGGGVAQLESRCNGGGLCVAAAASACASPYACNGPNCISPGLLIYWPLDEDSGAAFQDASGNGRLGIGIGISPPAPSTMVAPVKFPNPRSRDFNAAYAQGIATSPIPAPIKTTYEVTLAAWFRATAAEAEGSNIVSLGGDYYLRIKHDRVEFLKRKSTQTGAIFGVASNESLAPVDSKWHHLAGTSGAVGMKIYLDGIEVGSYGGNQAPIFNGPDQVGVGFQPGTPSRVLTGQIDDVRIYGRVLTSDEIANLARGNR